MATRLPLAWIPALTLFLALSATGQEPAGIRIDVDQEGLYFVPFSQLFPLLGDRMPRGDTLALFRDGEQVPLRIRGAPDGRLDPQDGIVFWGEPPLTGPTRQASYVLRETNRPLRIPRRDSLHPDQPREQGPNVWSFEKDEVFDALATVRQDLIRAERPPSTWFWKRLDAPGADPRGPGSQAAIGLDLDPAPVWIAPATLRLRFLGPVAPGVPQKIAVSVNGTQLEPVTWDTPLWKEVVFELPPKMLFVRNEIVITNLSPVARFAEPDNETAGREVNRLLLDSVSVEGEVLYTGPDRPTSQYVYRIPPPRRRGERAFKFAQHHREGFEIYAVDEGVFIEGDIVSGLPDAVTRVCVTGAQGWLKPVTIQPLRLTRAHEKGPGGDWVVVTLDRLRPALLPLIELRESQGLKPVVVSAREIFDTFAHGAPDPLSIRTFLRAAAANWETKPRWLLLVGDADRDVDWISRKETLPALQVMTDYNGSTAADPLLGDLDGDGVPEVAVGRLPVRSPEVLLRIVARIHKLETAPPSGAWRREVRFLAGQGGFGPAVDGMLESFVKRVLSEKIPAEYRTGITRTSPGSPWSYPVRGLAEEVVRQLSDGCLAWTYVGHAGTFGLQTAAADGRRWPVLDTRTVKRVNSEGRNPIVSFIACWTGEFDRPEADSLAELLFRQPGGPAAVIAASRISHPFPDALIGLGLAEAFFAEPKTIGEVLLEAKRSMLAAARGPMRLMAGPFLSKAVDPDLLVRDHLAIDQLFGDPAMRMPRPRQTVALELAETVAAGSGLIVQGHLAEGVQGRVLLSLDRRLGTKPATEPDTTGLLPEEADLLRYRSVAEVSIATAAVEHAQGTFSATLEVPADLPAGRYIVRAYLETADGADGAGAAPVQVVAAEPSLR